jgi:hypothetical protein
LPSEEFVLPIVAGKNGILATDDADEFWISSNNRKVSARFSKKPTPRSAYSEDVMNKLSRLIAAMALVLGAFFAFCELKTSYATQQPNTPSGTEQNSAIKVSIATGGGLFGPPRDHYSVGQRIPVSITMTNNSDQPVQVCDSDTVYQDHPKLLKDGQPVSYILGQTQILRTMDTDRTCFKLDVPDPVILKPEESRVVDWFILAEGSDLMGDMAWYEPLGPGKYELSIQRRLGCCDGPMFQSNKINFEVVP